MSLPVEQTERKGFTIPIPVPEAARNYKALQAYFEKLHADASHGDPEKAAFYRLTAEAIVVILRRSFTDEEIHTIESGALAAIVSPQAA